MLDIKAWQATEKARQKKHDAFSRLPRAEREAAMRHVRERKAFNQLVTIEELIEAHITLRGGL